MTTAAQLGKKPPVPDYDHCVLTISGIRYLVPRKAALAFFEGLGTKDVYRVDSWWRKGEGSVDTVEFLHPNEAPSISAYSLVQFHIGRVNRQNEIESRNKTQE